MNPLRTPLSVMLPLLTAYLALPGGTATSAVPRPDFDLSARVKQHRRGAQGNLVDGEEHLRKIIVQWDRVDGAEEYEICHACHIDDTTGELLGMGDNGQILKVETGRKGECGSRPCLVMPGAPLGYNRFNLRVRVGEDWSVWSTHRNFNVEELGTVEHEEL